MQTINKSALASVLACMMFLNIHSIKASSYPYFGTQREANGEHVILFKLPKSISSQIQEQFQQKQQPFPDSAQQQQQQQLQLQPQQSLILTASNHDSGQQDEPAVEEHSAVLTIPLSGLSGLQSRPAASVDSSPSVRSSLLDYPAETQQSQVQIISSNDLPAFDDSKERVGTQSVQQLNALMAALTGNMQPADIGYPTGQSAQSHQQHSRQSTSNLTASIEQQLRQLISQHADLYGGATSAGSQASNVGQSQVEVPHLFRDTYAQADQQEDAVKLNQAVQLDSPRAQDNQATLSLLNKLANSSPELLLRLRALLRRAGQRKLEGSAVRNSTYESLC